MKHVLRVILAGTAVISVGAQAANGDQYAGYGVTAMGMGGASIANPVDATAAVNNPAEQFHVPEYTPVLRQEAPILDALLVQRVARAYGFQRSGRLIRDRVLKLADQRHHVQQAGFEEVFVWHAEGDVLEWSTYRVPVSAIDARSIEEIAAEELRTAASIIDAPDPALEVARLLGVKRLTGAAGQRIERILNA